MKMVPQQDGVYPGLYNHCQATSSFSPGKSAAVHRSTEQSCLHDHSLGLECSLLSQRRIKMVVVEWFYKDGNSFCWRRKSHKYKRAIPTYYVRGKFMMNTAFSQGNTTCCLSLSARVLDIKVSLLVCSTVVLGMTTEGHLNLLGNASTLGVAT